MVKILLTVSLISLAGCSSTAHEQIPQPEQSMRDVYDSKMGGLTNQQGTNNKASVTSRQASNTDADLLDDYSRTSYNEIEQLFPKLPNPMLIMYVAPHVSGGIPVPGYTTAFPMYEVDQFAMPGEAK